MFQTGKAVIKDPNGILCWYEGLSYSDANEFREKVEKLYANGSFSKRPDSAPFYSALNDFNVFGSWYGEEGREEAWIRHRAECAKKYRTFISFSTEWHQNVNVGYWEDYEFAFLYYGAGNQGVLVPAPERYLEYIPPKDYSALTPEQIRLELSGATQENVFDLLPLDARDSVTAASIRNQLESEKIKLDALMAEMKDVENAANGELAVLKKEIEKKTQELYEKKAAMLAELSEKKASMEIRMEEFGTQIYMLEAQIYAIECYAGQTVKFARIRSGRNAPDDTPVIVHQKFRFLDEELGKLASLYEIQWDEMDLFESFLRHHPLALETFAPDERCVVMVRLSRTNTTIGRNQNFPYSNLMSTYRYYHGTTVGLIIRNGENLYMGWTEENRVNLSDNLVFGKESAIVKPQQETPPKFHSEVERLDYVKKQVKSAREFTDEIINRAFIFNILQGVVDHSNILPMPEPVSFMQPGKYIIFSMADNWLADTRFGSFTEILERCSKDPKKGDMILTTQHLIAERRTNWSGGWVDQSWHNDRGRGIRNRTHDVCAENGHIYPVNLVEYDEPVPKIRYRYAISPAANDIHRAPNAQPAYLETVVTEKRNADGSASAENRLPEGAEIVERFDYVGKHVFISLPKTNCLYRWDSEDQEANPRANFELYEGEYINLTFLNSVWLTWVVNNRFLGDWKIKGEPVTYAYGIKYLKTALDFIKKREIEEKRLIEGVDPTICENSDWPLQLSEWKLEHDVRVMTEYQAKRFVKSIKKKQQEKNSK